MDMYCCLASLTEDLTNQSCDFNSYLGLPEHCEFPAVVLNSKKRMALNYEIFLDTCIFRGTTMIYIYIDGHWRLTYYELDGPESRRALY